MCGRIFVPEDAEFRMLRMALEQLEKRNLHVKTGEVNPGDAAAVIARSRKIEPAAFAMHWGYHLPDGKLVFNTRSETAAEKRMFADGIHQRRCLIPAVHYFEWEKTSNGKQKYAIAPKDCDGFCLAGIYRMEGEIPVFSVLTREPAADIAFIHNRMPVIIPPTLYADWLNPENAVQTLLREAVSEMTFRRC